MTLPNYAWKAGEGGGLGKEFLMKLVAPNPNMTIACTWPRIGKKAEIHTEKLWREKNASPSAMKQTTQGRQLTLASLLKARRG